MDIEIDKDIKNQSTPDFKDYSYEMRESWAKFWKFWENFKNHAKLCKSNELCAVKQNLAKSS